MVMTHTVNNAPTSPHPHPTPADMPTCINHHRDDSVLRWRTQGEEPSPTRSKSTDGTVARDVARIDDLGGASVVGGSGVCEGVCGAR